MCKSHVKCMRLGKSDVLLLKSLSDTEPYCTLSINFLIKLLKLKSMKITKKKTQSHEDTYIVYYNIRIIWNIMYKSNYLFSSTGQVSLIRIICSSLHFFSLEWTNIMKTDQVRTCKRVRKQHKGREIHYL